MPGTRGNQFQTRAWLALAPFAIVAFGLAYWGFDHQCTGTPCTSPTGLERVEHAFDLVRGRGGFALGKDPWQLVLAQWLLPLAAGLTAAKLFLQSLRRDLRVAFARRSRDHVIVCGLGDTGRAITEQLRAAGARVVAIDLDATSVNALAVADAGAPTIRGDARSTATLRIAGLRRARALVVTTGNDTTNLEIALTVAQDASALARAGGKLVVAPEMRTDWLFERFLRQTETSLSSERVDFQIFNRSEIAARVLYRRPVFAARAAAGVAETVIAVIGFGDLGRAVLAQGALTGFALPGHRLRAIVLDAEPEAALAKFHTLYPGSDDIVATEPIKGRLTGQEPDTNGLLAKAIERGLAAVFVCLPDDADALFVATRVRGMLDGEEQRGIPVFVRTRARRKIADFLALGQDNPPVADRFVPFGDCADLIASNLLADRQIDRTAQACHDAYLEAVGGELDQEDAKGQAGHLPWPMLPELFRRSNRLFADHIEIKLRAAGLRSSPAASPRPLAFTQAECDGLAAHEHGRWVAERRMAGWDHGAVRDDLRLRHPALVDWADLPTAMQAQTRSIVARIPAILARIGLEIRRDLLVVCRPGAIEDAASLLEAFDPAGIGHLVLVLDPNEPESRSLALRAVSKPHVTLRLQRPAAALGDTPSLTRAAGFTGLSEIERRLLNERIDGCFAQPERRATPIQTPVSRNREPAPALLPA